MDIIKNLLICLVDTRQLNQITYTRMLVWLVFNGTSTQEGQFATARHVRLLKYIYIHCECDWQNRMTARRRENDGRHSRVVASVSIKDTDNDIACRKKTIPNVPMLFSKQATKIMSQFSREVEVISSARGWTEESRCRTRNHFKSMIKDELSSTTQL